MKVIVFLALAAFAQSLPYHTGWYGVGSTYEPGLYGWKLFQTPWIARGPIRSILTKERPVAETAARNIVSDLGRKYDLDIEELISRLGREQRIAGSTYNPRTANIIAGFREELRNQQGNLDLDEIRRIGQLKDTLGAAIEAQLTTDNVDRLVGRFTKTADQDNGIFEARIKKLIDKFTIVDIQVELTKQHKIIRQLVEQEEFLEQQKQQLEAQKSIVSERGTSVPVEKLRVAEERIKEEQKYLTSEKYARYLVIKMLRGKLFEEEDKLTRDSITKNAWIQLSPDILHCVQVDFVTEILI
ncbi:hypothetical protein GWI33_003010 [Rhynchophorus ferrugineus]|uniref:Uncharacterized protein n=1 Tax=Rhynchophorus ferrugineus TaxID=354439 RepID=A0A834MJA3_RHYFE|nr:hypothetical protein GWI33_003010 [Rhynchophorus ferrugineus]